MLTEIEHAAGWWADQLKHVTNGLTPSTPTIEHFKQALCVELSLRYAGHWNPSESQRGSAYRCISYDHRIDSTLLRAASSVGITNFDELIIHARWNTMFVNPGLVKVQNTKMLAKEPTIVYCATSGGTDATTTAETAATTLVPILKSCVSVPTRRSSLMTNPSRTVMFTSPIIAPLSTHHEVDDEENILSPAKQVVTVITPSILPRAPRSALKGHHRSQSTSPIATPLSVRFMSGSIATFNPDAATFVPKTSSPPPMMATQQQTISHVSVSILPAAAVMGTSSTSPTASSTPTATLSPPARTTSPQAVSPPVRTTSPQAAVSAVHHSSRSVDLNSTLFASLSLNKATTVSSNVSPTRVALAPVSSNDSRLAPQLAPQPTVFAHMTRHKTSHSMFSFPTPLTISPTHTSISPTAISPSAISPTSSTSSSLNLPRQLVSHHRGLSASLLPSAALYASEVATLRHTHQQQQLVR